MKLVENILLSPSISMGVPPLIQTNCFSVASDPLCGKVYEFRRESILKDWF